MLESITLTDNSARSYLARYTKTMLDKQTFTDRLTQLVECKTLSGDVAENAKALDLVTGWLDINAKIKRVQNGKAEILIAGNTDSVSPDFAFMVHMDVVAGKPDQFEMVVDGDKAKGVCQINIHSTGSPAHASRPWLGMNALEPLILIAAKLVKEFSETNKKESWMTTMNIGVIQGGISTNQVCPEADMKLDFRFPETESVEKILERVRGLTREVGGEIGVELSSTGKPTFTDKNLPVVKKFIRAIEIATGRKIEVKPTYGASDARWFSGQNTPVLMIKPVGGEIHSDHEWISLSSCLEFYKGLRGFLFGLQ